MFKFASNFTHTYKANYDSINSIPAVIDEHRVLENINKTLDSMMSNATS